MDYDHKKVDKFGKIVVDAMMLGLLWAIIALPISSFSLVQLDTSGADVLSEQDYRTKEDVMPKPGDDTKAVRGVYYESETEDVLEIIER